MNRWSRLLAVALLVLSAGCSQSTADRVDEVEKLLNAGIPMPDTTRAQAQALRDEARRMLDAGDTAAADAAAEQALALLRRAKDAALLNKSDG